MESSLVALPTLKRLATPDASEHRRKESIEANKVSFSDYSTCCSDSAEDSDSDDDRDSVCSRSSVIDDAVCIRAPIGRPALAKPRYARPSASTRVQKLEDEVSVKQLPASSADAEVQPQAVPSTTDQSDATVSDRCAGVQTWDELPRLRRRKLDPLKFQSSPTTADASASPSGGRVLCGGRFSTLPTKPTSSKPSNFRASRYASSCGTEAQASSSSQADTSPASEVVVLQQADSKGSGLAYNLVQFKASPSLSTAQGAGKLAQAISAPRTKRDEGEETKKPKMRAKHDAEQVLKKTFSGWSKKEVKAALEGTYSREEIAEVLEALDLKSSKMSTNKRASA
eukprot:TRINITY_DN8700_c0_g1_i2.p1 TRINITY_DN8700_c0_g1~~TRINITY_DN8700_c0_g1_i2.p1  ORF type:complete len:340 (+),score=59.83 TRINITY_DN8700_c0_g1_i2:66-1085(+)